MQPTRRVRLALLVLAVVSVPAVVSTAASAATVSQNAPCKKVGATATASGYSFACKSVTGKKVWRKTSKVKDGVVCQQQGATIVTWGSTWQCQRSAYGKLRWKRIGPAPTPTTPTSTSPTTTTPTTTPTTTTSSTSTTTTVPASPLDALKVSQTVGSVRSGSEGPAVARVVLRTSSDGVSFSGREVLMDQAGVPNLLAHSSGRLYAYYQDWANGNIMGVAVRSAGTGTWQRYKVKVEGIDIWSNPNGVDPSAVELSDGRIRLYWMSRLGGNRIYSATSTLDDTAGIIFTYDGSYALEVAGEIFDPTVVATPSGWAMWVDVAGVPTYATSADGLTFTKQASNSPFTNTMTFPWGASTAPSGRIRVIASVRGAGGYDGVVFESSDGGTSFTELTRTALPVGALGDTGLTYDATTSTWYQLVSERM